MNSMLKTLLALNILATFCFAQQQQYGSVSRQMTVERNIELQRAETERIKYRKFREEVRRSLPPEPQVQVVYVRRQCCLNR